ncbi:hypothetical protein RUND412_001149 [Rhizina undulata]
MALGILSSTAEPREDRCSPNARLDQNLRSIVKSAAKLATELKTQKAVFEIERGVEPDTMVEIQFKEGPQKLQARGAMFSCVISRGWIKKGGDGNGEDLAPTTEDQYTQVTPSSTNPPPPAPTGCEYYVIQKINSSSSGGSITHYMRRIPLDPNRLTYTAVEAQLLYELEENKIAAIEALVRDRNSRTVEEGEWVVVGLQLTAPERPEELRLIIEFYRYGGFLNEPELCLQANGTVVEERHQRQNLVDLDENVTREMSAENTPFSSKFR